MTQPPFTNPAHQQALRQDAQRQVTFFHQSLTPDGRFAVLDGAGRPLAGPQELHTTTRMVHSYALAGAAGLGPWQDVVDAGMAFLWTHHRDTRHGGYVWSVGEDGTGGDDTKLAYGHVFVLLAAASALHMGHPDAKRLLDDVAEVLDRHFWDDGAGLYRDEYRRDWTPFSTYRGMNANMHGVEAMLAAYEATGDTLWLDRAGRILAFFTQKIAPEYHWRLPEHYTEGWDVDPDYRGNPMFRPAGTTPGHSLELGRLVLQHWDLTGRADADAPTRARRLIDQAWQDAWRDDGGFVYTLHLDGTPAIRDRYWWPVTEAIGAQAALLSLDPREKDIARYHQAWDFADRFLIDTETGGWWPELDENGRPTARQFIGKPDIYHAIQADLISLCPGVSRLIDRLRG